MIVRVEEILGIERGVNWDEYIEKVRPIVERVRKEGDRAILEFTKQFDGVELKYIRVPKSEVDRAYEVVDDEIIDALEKAREEIERFHTITAVERDMKIDFGDCVMGKRYTPIERVGIYVPGGRYGYPSTALMAGVPARIAGVKRIVVCTPPNRDGRVSPLTLIACDIVGIREIYAVGGAQAIAAMAYGTETIPKVEKIVGPGNVYVTAAKLIVQKDVAIDMPAGPSEIMVIADESANPEYVALDCVAQLEHDPMSIAVLLTTSRDLAERVEEIAKGFDVNVENLKIAIVKSLEEAIDVANKFAPEHLSLMFKGAEDYIDRIENAGSVFIGEFSPVACGDYASGTNHILPTSGYARVFSGVSVETFMKHMTYQMLSESALRRIGDVVVKLAKAEGFKYHALSVEKRLSPRSSS